MLLIICSGLNQAATNFYSFEQGRIAAYRLYEMISRSTSAVNQDGRTLSSVQGNIEFRNVYFSYLSRPEIPILSGFYLTVPARKTVALVGRNGSGKSSIIPLMERFYDPTLGIIVASYFFFYYLVTSSTLLAYSRLYVAGEVLLDGENIKNLKLEWLRSQIGLVTQEPALLSLSIRENIAYGRSATTDQIEEAAKTAHAHTFISSLEKGYETQVPCMLYLRSYCNCILFYYLLFCRPCLILTKYIIGWPCWAFSDGGTKDKALHCSCCALKSINSFAG
jgi:ATP-binding cassette subfamily B (MDR/TAP) protein 1